MNIEIKNSVDKNSFISINLIDYSVLGEIRLFIQNELSNAGLKEIEIQKIVVAIDEICTNLIKHALGYKTFEINDKGCLQRLASNSTDLDLANLGRQSFPKTYIANGYVDVLSTKFIRDNGLIHGSKVHAFMTNPTGEIDTENDFMHLEYELLQKNYPFLQNF